MSNIQVFVQWKNSTVFAGEEIECKITFKNVSQTSRARQPQSPIPRLKSAGSGRGRWKNSLPLQIPAGHFQSPTATTTKTFHHITAAHRPTWSLGSSVATRHIQSTEVSEQPWKDFSSKGHNHKRSVSIVSLGGEATNPINGYPDGQPQGTNRPGRSHNRAASLQVLPRRNGADPGALLANGYVAGIPSSLGASVSFDHPRVQARVRIQSSGQTSTNGSSIERKALEPTSPSFRFPNSVASYSETSPYELVDPSLRFPSPNNESVNATESLKPITRILSPISMSGTPRSSIDFYTTSNNSLETLASEYISQDPSRLSTNGPHARQLSLLGPMNSEKAAETLMMGYGQIAGSFTLDGSLVNQAPFEEVKRKGIIGGQGGGGVVRAESVKREGGLFGGIGWGSIGESLGGFLGSNELSSIRETKDTAGTKSIPILSTPQSVLFVNLQLKPGESKSYKFRHPLPRGIPPTHKGRAMKVSYRLIIGTQRAARDSVQHHVQNVNIPFRVLSGVNGQGEILGHDLMSPYILLHNAASIFSTDEREKEKPNALITNTSNPETSEASIDDFLTYVGASLDGNRQKSGLGLLSPTENYQSVLTPTSEPPSTTMGAIELALLKSNSATSRRNANRFEITRAGARVAVIVLARSAYRLGEAIFATIDFQDSEISCYSLRATLESFEIIDPTIALRSKATVQRVTRRIHASNAESTIFATRVNFAPIVPINATPDFVTSGVSLEWVLRFEFVTSRNGSASESHELDENLLEEIARDERGSVIAAVQGIPCEIFDITVPLRIYGATSGFDEKMEAGSFPI